MSVNSILTNSEGMSRRLANMEISMTSGSCLAAESVRSVPETRDDVSETTVKLGTGTNDHSQSSPLEWKPIGLDTHVEDELHASRVYIRTERRHSLSSLSTNSFSNPGWSFLSGLSLAQMSSVAVVALPLTLDELWNPQHYKLTDRTLDESATMIGFVPKVKSNTQLGHQAKIMGYKSNRLSVSFRNNAEVGLAACPDTKAIGNQPSGVLGKRMKQTVRILLLGKLSRNLSIASL